MLGWALGASADLLNFMQKSGAAMSGNKHRLIVASEKRPRMRETLLQHPLSKMAPKRAYERNLA
jgi:hypothetical protein